MEESLESPQGSKPIQESPAESITLSDAMTGVITEPGTTYEAVKNSTKKNYWIIPILILIVVYLISSFLVINDEELFSEIKTKQTERMREGLEKAVKEGSMTKEQMEERIEQTEKMFDKSSPIFLLISILGPVFTIFISLFFRGLVFWGATKILKGAASYLLVLPVLGLASVIDSIQTIVDTGLAILLGRLQANIGPALLFTEDAVGETMMKFLGHFDVFNIWYLIVVGIGLAKVSNLKSSKTIMLVFALWLVWVCLTSFIKLPFFG